MENRIGTDAETHIRIAAMEVANVQATQTSILQSLTTLHLKHIHWYTKVAATIYAVHYKSTDTVIAQTNTTWQIAGNSSRAHAISLHWAYSWTAFHAKSHVVSSSHSRTFCWAHLWSRTCCGHLACVVSAPAAICRSKEMHSLALVVLQPVKVCVSRFLCYS